MQLGQLCGTRGLRGSSTMVLSAGYYYSALLISCTVSQQQHTGLATLNDHKTSKTLDCAWSFGQNAPVVGIEFTIERERRLVPVVETNCWELRYIMGCNFACRIVCRPSPYDSAVSQQMRRTAGIGAAWPPARATMTKPLRWRGFSLSSLGAAARRRRERPFWW